MAADPTKPEVSAKIGGKSYALRFDKRAIFRLGAPDHADAQGEVGPKNSAAVFRRACMYAFCMMIDPTAFKSAEDVAGALKNSELDGLSSAINKAIEAGGEGEADDPL